MITFSSAERSKQKESMDEFSLKGEEMKLLLTDLKRVNRLLGGNKVTLSGIGKLLEDWPKERTCSIIDLGCGDGEMLRTCKIWAKKNGYDFELIGVDANEHILEEAKFRSKSVKGIRFMNFDVFDKEKIPDTDIVLCTLFLHHLKNEEIIKLMKLWLEKARIGAVINDLQRSRWAFLLFSIVRWFLLRTKTARHDGLVSVARGFRKKELLALSESMPGNHYIRWKWAFRYRWIVRKT